MSQQHKLGSHKTSVFTDENGFTNIVYHSTAVVRFNQEEDKIIVNSGGWHTNTTKTRINQASNQFRLGFNVWQKDFSWFITNAIGETLPFVDGMVLTFPE